MKKRIQTIYIKHKETIHNFIWRSLQIFGKQGITFLIFIIAAKLLTPFEFGIYNYVLAIVFFLIIFGDFGISIATSNYVAECSTTDTKKIKLILFNSAIIILGLSVIVTLITILFGKYFLFEKYVYILWTLPLIFLAPITSLYDGIYRGLKKFKELAIVSLLTGVISLGFIYFLIKNYSLFGALMAQNLFYLLLVIALAFGYNDFDIKIDREIIKNIVNYSILVGLANVGYFFYTRVDIIILGQFGFIEEIGYYEIINKVFAMLIIPVMLLATVIAPNTTKNFTLKRYDYIKSKLLEETSFLFIIGIVVAIVCYLMLPYFFKIFFEEYNILLLVSLLNILLLLIPFRFFSTYINIGYITPGGFVKILTRNTLIFGLLNLILDIFFIKSLGYIGVVYATLISQFLFMGMNMLNFSDRLKNG